MTELIWEGKYKDGKKVAPVRLALPFQKVETINKDLRLPPYDDFTRYCIKMATGSGKTKSCRWPLCGNLPTQ